MPVQALKNKIEIAKHKLAKLRSVRHLDDNQLREIEKVKEELKALEDRLPNQFTWSTRNIRKR